MNHRAASAAKPCRILVVDSDRRVRESLAALLALSPNIEVVGTAGRGEDAFELVEEGRPDVVIVDPRLPDERTGLELVARLRLLWPSLRILVGGANGTGAKDAIAAGADEFVPKCGVEEFMAAIVRVAGLPDRAVVRQEQNTRRMV